MRRKLIRQGEGTITISLPKNWVSENKLKKGNEVELEERNNEIIVRAEKVNRKNTASIKLGKESSDTYRSIIGGLYRGGYDEIEIELIEKEGIANIEKAINSLYGFEVFYVSNNRCIVRSIYDSEKIDIKSHVLRIIHTIKTIQGIVVEDLEKGKLDSKKEVYELRNNVLKQRDLIMRVIKKERLLGNEVFPYYTIVLSLWGVTRNYYHLYKNLVKGDKRYMGLLRETNDYFNRSFERMDNLSTQDFLRRHKRYSKAYNKVLERVEESKILSFCLQIITEVQLSDSSIYLLNYG
jgi:phosphate uptake regulator